MSIRYQRVSSPDGVPLALSNVKRSITNGRILHTTTNTTKPIVNSTSCSTLEGKGFRFRSPSRTTQDLNTTLEAAPTSPQSENHHHDSPPPPAKNHQAQIPTQNPKRDRSPSPGASASPSPGRGAGVGNGDMLLQWGQRKRARVSRTDVRVPTDDSASSSSSSAAIKSQRRLTPALSMPPPPLPLPPASTSNGTTRPRREASSLLSNRNLEDRSGRGGNGSPSRNGVRVLPRSTAGKRSPPPEKHDRKVMLCSGSAKDEKPNGSSDRVGIANHTLLEQESRRSNAAAPLAGGGGGEKVNFEVTEWPRIYISLSRKEKEDDFLAMKGTKLSQRPKKRAKNIDKALQYCFPGMWLSDLTRNRYEVREKKCVKKQKRRGLKGMESFDSESE
ncbi:microtubule cross-linking factor 1-like [Juglans microcarpa x Juglans regia]|uniref:microtubule cross-linking factor 1-like n=1 Tax=Juglans microcarpa x Juglans regia TaxID=2249226 RepID=UPI001B7DA9DC|nr:microtubule cross-linking factor 1-like [Juglans microcarpa x Juglans regia]